MTKVTRSLCRNWPKSWRDVIHRPPRLLPARIAAERHCKPVQQLRPTIRAYRNRPQPLKMQSPHIVAVTPPIHQWSRQKKRTRNYWSVSKRHTWAISSSVWLIWKQIHCQAPKHMTTGQRQVQHRHIVVNIVPVFIKKVWAAEAEAEAEASPANHWKSSNQTLYGPNLKRKCVYHCWFSWLSLWLCPFMYSSFQAFKHFHFLCSAFLMLILFPTFDILFCFEIIVCNWTLAIKHIGRSIISIIVQAHEKTTT